MKQLWNFSMNLVINLYIGYLCEEVVETGLCNAHFTLTQETENRHHYLHFYVKESSFNICDEEYNFTTGRMTTHWTYTIDQTGASVGKLEAGFDYMKAMIEAGATLDIWGPDEFSMTAEWMEE